MNITAELIKSILTQAGDITCKNIRNESEYAEDIIIRFEDDTDTTVSIYYTAVSDLIAIGTINSLGEYRNHTRYRDISQLNSDIFSQYLTNEIFNLELDLEIEEMI